MPLINCKTELSLKWIENCMLTSAAIGANANATGADSATFKITNAKLYVQIVTLAAESNAKLILSKNIFFQDLKLKITISKLMVEIFLISQLMNQLNNMMK